MTSGASYMRTMPSEEQVASWRPRCLGANLTSVTLVRESTSEVRFTQEEEEGSEEEPPCSSPAETSSQMVAVRSKEHVASTCPNSGWAHVTLQTLPEWAFQCATCCEVPSSAMSHTLML